VPVPAGIEIRLYRDSDYGAVTSFECAGRHRPWAKEAQGVIRKAPDDVREPDADAIIAVALDGKRLVGVIVFGTDPKYVKTRTIFTIGVVCDRRREGIGFALKAAALAELAFRGYDGPVYSQVHKYNREMRGLNEKFLAKYELDPDAGKYLLTVVRPSPTP